MLVEREAESCYLGQFIPVQYHHNMLMELHRNKLPQIAAVYSGAIPSQYADGCEPHGQF